MACMSGNDKCPNGNFGDTSQLTNYILGSRAMCHMTPEVLDFIPGWLEDTDEHIEVADGHHVTAKRKVQVRIKMCDDNGDSFIATLQNLFLAPDLCDMLFSIITLINLGHTCLLQNSFALCTSEQKRKIRLHYHTVHKGNMCFGGK